MKNFEYRIIPAAQWRRLRGTTAKGNVEDRPHIVATTDRAKSFMSVDALGAMGRTGLCPGEILVDGAWEIAYRFIDLTEEAAEKMLPDIEKELARVMEADRCP